MIISILWVLISWGAAASAYDHARTKEHTSWIEACRAFIWVWILWPLLLGFVIYDVVVDRLEKENRDASR